MSTVKTTKKLTEDKEWMERDPSYVVLNQGLIVTLHKLIGKDLPTRVKHREKSLT